MGFLGGCRFGFELASVVISFSVGLPNGLGRSLQGGFREIDRIGTHVGDMPFLVKPLGNSHGFGDPEPQFAGCFLLQSRGGERRRRAFGGRLFLDGFDGPIALACFLEPRAYLFFVVKTSVEFGFERRLYRSIGGCGLKPTVNPKGCLGLEGRNFSFSVHENPDGYGLYPSCGKRRLNFAPQQRG